MAGVTFDLQVLHMESDRFLDVLIPVFPVVHSHEFCVLVADLHRLQVAMECAVLVKQRPSHGASARSSPRRSHPLIRAKAIGFPHDRSRGPSAVFLDALQKPPDFCFDPSRSLKPNPQVLGGHGAGLRSASSCRSA